MSETQELKLNITANDEASPVIRKLVSEINKLSRLAGKLTATPKLNIAGQSAGKSISDDIAKSTAAVTKSLQTRLAGEREISAVQNRRERDRQIGESRTMAGFRRSLAFTSRMAAQRLREERDVERARARTEREQAAGVRRQIGLDRYRMGLRSRYEREQAAADRRAQRDDDRQRVQDQPDPARPDQQPAPCSCRAFEASSGGEAMSAPIGLNLGEARRRQARAKDRRQRMNVEPDVRARRAAAAGAAIGARIDDRVGIRAHHPAVALVTGLGPAGLGLIAPFLAVGGRRLGRGPIAA